ncbi:M20 aminoacylase family protein [Methylobacterium nodulans]|uniref:Amidohydrolase n=1 Tax=Methylobacterium nodulans (strain LMG 21967 / CNCM I-2342 / ORS 2060) TaxID=460265 RepID=B8I9N6_METNO|nr:M20 aminoacylase family protein [Methylobacterium nodulans]ACL55289.1 amidohydrolase [Methylobacterium nodulans ORS 2060]
MPVINRVAALTDEITAWRRDFHQHPELLFAVDRTAGLVAERLRAFGCDEVVTGLGRTGVVGVIRGRRGGSGRTIGLRADMDALPIEEATEVPYRSAIPGKMHACGHDGHTAMLLGAAKYLAETRNFDGTAVVIFQPAEEGGGGGDAMVKDGLMERFGIQEVYGLHNKPGLPLGHFAIRPGPIMAAVDRFTITIEGRGGHAAQPQECVDTVLISAHVITALQSIVARNADPVASAVVSVTTMRAGEAFNVLPQTAVLNGTVRSLTEPVRRLCEERIGALAAGIASAFGATAQTSYSRGYPVTDNHPDQAAFMADVAAEVAGEEGVDRAVDPMMGAEDFSYMLEQRPGAYIFLGTGDGPGLHHPAYDFNDAATPYGVSLWARLIERAMPA